MKLQLILQSSIFQILPDSFWTKKYFQSLPNNFGLRTRQTLYFPITPKTAGKKAVWKRGTLIKLLFYIQIFHRKPISLENNINLSWWVQVRCPLGWGASLFMQVYCRNIGNIGVSLHHPVWHSLGPSDIRVHDTMMSYFGIKCLQILSERNIGRNKRWGQMLKWGIVTNNFTDWSWN